MITQSNKPKQQLSADVLIVGAGPTGMTAALTLQRAGVNILIVDKCPHTRQHSQAVVLWPRTLEILDLLDVAEDWRSKSIPVTQFAVNFAGHSNLLRLPPIDSPFPHPWCVGQDVTEAILQSRMTRQNIALMRSVEATEIQVRENSILTTLRSDDGSTTTVESKWILGCEGSHSLVRESAGIQRSGAKNPGVQLIQGDVKLRGNLTLAPGTGYLLSDSNRHTVLIIPTSLSGHYRFLATVPDDGSIKPPTLDQLQAISSRFLPGVDLYDPVWLNRFRTQHQIADTFRKGRAFVVGDAAHVWVPIGGQGMNIAMQDAFDLGWKLGAVVNGELPETVLDTYTEERRPIGAFTIQYTEASYKALLEPQSLTSHLQQLLLPSVLGSSTLDGIIARQLAQIGFHYPHSQLVQDAGGSGHVKAGQRAPDAWVSHRGNDRRLFDLFREGKWTLLVWAFEEADYEPAREAMRMAQSRAQTFLLDCSLKGMPAGENENVLRDIGRLAAAAYGQTSSHIHLIRPDGVVGFSGPARGGSLERYLRNLTEASRALLSYE